jgi:hypothetical protein
MTDEKPGIRLGNSVTISDHVANKAIDTIVNALTEGSALKGKIPSLDKGSHTPER